jgi:hypothetical protein
VLVSCLDLKDRFSKPVTRLNNAAMGLEWDGRGQVISFLKVVLHRDGFCGSRGVPMVVDLCMGRNLIGRCKTGLGEGFVKAL